MHPMPDGWQIVGEGKRCMLPACRYNNSLFILFILKRIKMENIKGKCILLAGATGTIGHELAAMLKASGAQLFLTGRNKEKLINAASQMGISERNIFAADLTNPSEVQSLHTAYFEVQERIDVLINLSGIGILKSSDQLSGSDFLKVISINLYAPFLLVQAFLPAMKLANTGLILQVPGVLGKVPMAGAAAYSASKYGLTGMMQSIREELKRTNIRISNLFLGGTDTAFWDEIDMRVQRDKFITAAEAARTIWFLCQQPASGVISEMVLQPFNHQAI